MVYGIDDDTYDVEPGLCVIVNNMEFTEGESLPGGKKDEENLLELFTALRFDLKIHRNLTGKEITDTVKSYGDRQHRGAFFLIILSHGTSIDNRPAVLGTDNGAVVVSELECFFYASNCNSLHGRPKIFLIDACRGTKEERTFNPVRTSGMTTTKSSSSRRRLKRQDSGAIRSDSADFLIVNAATNGNVAFITDKGSYLTQAFVEVTSEAKKTDSLRDIITRVRVKVQDRDPHQTVESTDRLTRKYLIKKSMPTIQELQTKFDTQVKKWIPVRNETIEKIEKSIKQLKKHHKNVNISRITGSSLSVAGTLIAITGFILAHFTAGASIGLSACGIALAALGGGTAAGASIIDIFIQKSGIKDVQDQLDHDYKQLDGISQTTRNIKEKFNCARQEYPDIIAAVFGVVFAQGVRTTNLRMRVAEPIAFDNLEIGALVLRVGNAAARAIAIAGIVLTVVLIPIDIAETIRSSFSIRKGSQTEAIEKLINIVEQLKEQKAAIEDTYKCVQVKFEGQLQKV
jgi:uncharacterized spore protein YtfJ